jgi:hypothetical protein
MSKKERIEYLESEVTGLHAKVAELIRELEDLKKKQTGWIFNTSLPLLYQEKMCPWCHKEPADKWHYCPNYPSHWVDPNRQFTCTLTDNMGVLK